jgi:hypothetical protein
VAVEGETKGEPLLYRAPKLGDFIQDQLAIDNKIRVLTVVSIISMFSPVVGPQLSDRA